MVLSTGYYGNAVKNLQAIGNSGTWAGITNSLGDLVNNVTGNSANNQFNAIEAQKQRDWEERMSNTQYQRTVADMQAAGINPASLMSGASLSTLGSSSAASSGSGNNVIGSVLNSIIGLVKAFKGGSKVTKTFNYFKK